MMVIFVSQCEKNALKKTRRILDAFADRIGDNTWQTIITHEGLNAVRKLLRKTASKSTAVSCHWIRSRARSEFLWVVGNKRKFNLEGLVPVNTTRNNKYDLAGESNWHQLPFIQALAAVAGLLHDWGKASDLFQEKLHPDNKQSVKGDPVRHEWISCLLFSAFVRQGKSLSDSDWLERFSNGLLGDSEMIKSTDFSVEKSPFDDMPPLASWVLWLIVTHHRLPNLHKKSRQCSGLSGWDEQDANAYKLEQAPTMASVMRLVTKEWGYENRYDEADYQARLKKCFMFSKGLLQNSNRWLAELKRWSAKLAAYKNTVQSTVEDGSWRVVLQHARLCLMLGDHYFSSQSNNPRWPVSTDLHANTDRASHALKQKLDEHLCGVANAAIKNAYLLPSFEKSPPSVSDITALKERSPPAFSWQDKAVTSITNWRKDNAKEEFGFFAVNMASTGTGKTFANAKVMRALSMDGDSLRYTLALGLRTLTLQTGDEYRELIGLNREELAVLIGSKAVLELHNEKQKGQTQSNESASGSESKECLLDEYIDFDCNVPEEPLTTVLTQEKDRQFLYAPVLSCTIDHLMAVTECTRGGRYILPSLRMMSSDLVIDEVDDFSGDDLIAIGRLVFFAGMMGRKVMISSATIPPDLAEGYFKAYRDGWNLYSIFKQISPRIGCAWVDEFGTHVTSSQARDLKTAIEGYRNSHKQFIEKRIKALAKQEAKRKAYLVDCLSIISRATQETKEELYFSSMAQAAINLHAHHHVVETVTGLKVSFGVIRVANITPCVTLSRYFLEKYECPRDTAIRVMAYHSQQVLYLRSQQEKHLDNVLKRKEHTGEQPQAFSNVEISQHLHEISSKSPKVKNVLFILVATPVEEVGRDHDFDWAVIEPSSYRSIIQLAGRVRRHRSHEIEHPNIAIMSHNIKALQQSGCELSTKNREQHSKPVFQNPGFETEFLSLASHNLFELLDIDEIAQRLDAVPRIHKQEHWHSGYWRRLTSNAQYKAQSLVELEHASTWKAVANYSSKLGDGQVGPATFQAFLRECWWLTALPQTFVRFRQSDPSFSVYLTYLSEREEYRFCEKTKDGEVIDRENVLSICRESLSEAAKQRLWLIREHEAAFYQLAKEQQKSRFAVSLRFGELGFRYREGNVYSYNDQLGLVRK